MKGDGDGDVIEAQAKMYCSDVYNMMQWLHLDIFNAVFRLARHMTAPWVAHVRALMMLIKCIVSTENRWLVLSP
jgi:hypothetical protein